MATPDEGPIIRVGPIRQMILDEAALTRLPYGYIIYVFAGLLVNSTGQLLDPTTITGQGFGAFRRYDRSTQTVVYLPVVVGPRRPHHIGTVLDVRSQVTDPMSGMILPEGIQLTVNPFEQQIIVGVEGFVVDGNKYNALISEAPTEDDLY